MVYGTCPNCKSELEVNEYDEKIYNGKEKTHFVPLFLPSFGKCECGEKYAIDTDCDYDDAVLILDFYEYGKKPVDLKKTINNLLSIENHKK